MGRSHVEAFDKLGISLGQESRVKLNAQLANAISELGLPEGISIEEGDDEQPELVIASDVHKKAVQSWLKEVKPAANLKKVLTEAIKQAQGRKPTQQESDSGREWLCKNFFDIRTFGAVLSLKSAPNCGQVRGPAQLTFARSIAPIVALEHSITRMAVAPEAEAEKQQGDNRTMGLWLFIQHYGHLSEACVVIVQRNQSVHAKSQRRKRKQPIFFFLVSLCLHGFA